MAYLPEDTLERALDAVRGGMTWVVGPLTSIRSEHATLFQDCAYGPLERALAFRVTKRFPATGIDPDVIWTGPCERGKATLWCDVVEADGGAADMYALYESGPCAGMSAAVEIELGEGRVLVLGFLPDPGDTSWLSRIVEEAGIQPVCEATEGIAVVPRIGEKQRGWIAFDWKGLGGHAIMPGNGVNLLTDEAVCPVASLFAYGVAVVRAD
jgi:beta-galactosidase GanA